MTDSPITAAIHQPNFLPWIGFFYKWLKSDILVILDDVQFVRRGYTNRVKIKGPEGERWLTVPVIKKGKYYQKVDEVEIEKDPARKKKVTGSIRTCYGKAPYFKDYYPELESILEKDFTYLADMNIELLTWLARQLGTARVAPAPHDVTKRYSAQNKPGKKTRFSPNSSIEKKTVRASQLPGVTGRSTQRLVSICKSVGAERYLSGFGGQKYQEEEIFREENIELLVYDFTPPVYPQMWGEFIPGLSTLDLLFNAGPASKDLIK
jgi:hypothetical protein